MRLAFFVQGNIYRFYIINVLISLVAKKIISGFFSSTRTMATSTGAAVTLDKIIK